VFPFGFQTTDENWQLATIKEAAAVIFKVSVCIFLITNGRLLLI